MDASEYQRLAARTATDTDRERVLTNCAFGLIGEAGEVVDLIKKHIFHAHPLDENELVEEIGDLAWYLARICTLLNVDLSEALQGNIDKLRRRYPDGFNSGASIARVDKSLEPAQAQAVSSKGA